MNGQLVQPEHKVCGSVRVVCKRENMGGKEKLILHSKLFVLGCYKWKGLGLIIGKPKHYTSLENSTKCPSKHIF